MRLTQEELEAHPAWRGFGSAAGSHPPLRGWLAVPLVGSDGKNMGLIQLSDRHEGEFSESDEAILVQLAQTGASAIERTRLQERFLHAQKLEAVGQFAGGVAHDFNNLLTAINGYGDVALAELGPTSGRLRKSVEEMRRAGDRAAELTQQLLAFSRRQVMKPENVNLNAVVADLHSMLRRLIGEHVAVTTRLSPDLGVVQADRGQIGQVLVNLAVNARDAMPDGGTLVIETRNARLTSSEARAYPGLAPGDYVALELTDDGAGMDEETVAHIFDPFFTTKEPGEGTGLGLATVHGIVRQSGGYVGVYSEPGHGTTFTVYLPRVEGQEAVEVEDEPAPGLATGSETVLVVEDDAVVRGLVCDVLDELGYHVLVASGPAEALELVDEVEDHIDLLITDVVMPKMNGRELAERLLAVRPDLRVVYTSGYTGDAMVERGVLEPGVAFLQKPFALDSLARVAREVLAA
jgi:signal transduction histidine kinase